ncbi:MAG: hypothetical protein C0483_02045 [Pirellula sp.]|nr:hypothetical protein [Pirellula sp.]
MIDSLIRCILLFGPGAILGWLVARRLTLPQTNPGRFALAVVVATVLSTLALGLALLCLLFVMNFTPRD